MPIAFSCPTCSKPLRARDELAGRTTRCPQCQSPVKIPGPPPDVLPVAPAAGKWQLFVIGMRVVYFAIFTALLANSFFLFAFCFGVLDANRDRPSSGWLNAGLILTGGMVLLVPSFVILSVGMFLCIRPPKETGQQVLALIAAVCTVLCITWPVGLFLYLLMLWSLARQVGAHSLARHALAAMIVLPMPLLCICCLAASLEELRHRDELPVVLALGLNLGAIIYCAWLLFIVGSIRSAIIEQE